MKLATFDDGAGARRERREELRAHRVVKVALGAQRAAKKSELLRAGLHALATLDAAALVAALNALAPVKVGRPRKGH